MSPFNPQFTVEQHQDSIVGQSAAITAGLQNGGRVSHSNTPVLITGEGVSGKDLVARAIPHYGNTQARDTLNSKTDQMAKSAYSGFTSSVGGKSIPAPAVAFVPCSMRMKDPVRRLVA